MSAPTVRWYHRLAAWLYGVIGEPLMELATPVWTEEADADLEEMHREEEEAYRAEEEASARAAYEEGCADGYREAEREYRPEMDW